MKFSSYDYGHTGSKKSERCVLQTPSFWYDWTYCCLCGYGNIRASIPTADFDTLRDGLLCHVWLVHNHSKLLLVRVFLLPSHCIIFILRAMFHVPREGRENCWSSTGRLDRTQPILCWICRVASKLF